ncbi:MAG: SPASM domain-containing protein, partial [Armatimonadota bacterium]
YGEKINILAADSLGYCYGNSEKILKDAEWSGCSAGCYIAGIEENGNVKGCLSLQDDYFTAGNVKKRSLIDIWNDDSSFTYTRKYDVSKMTGYCADCESKKDCRSGCLGMAYSLGGSIYENPYCYKRITGN